MIAIKNFYASQTRRPFLSTLQAFGHAIGVLEMWFPGAGGDEI
jgi:hypothetical protein